MAFPFEKRVEFGATNVGKAVGGTEDDAASNSADDDDAGLVACRQFQPVAAQAAAEVISIGAGRPCGSDMLPSLRQIDPSPLGRLMRRRRECLHRLRSFPQHRIEAVGQIAPAFGPQGRQNGQIMRTRHHGMPE
ncbi:hypothetical protein [Paradevosia shaoguanensis]|uniref:hypothetical protein n=1 Tax=Paradevosia shaoguanensis TaxID=1335043 RepID=UPI001932FD57|nr:hypothetical protein [Paradevosia shaoguanensis]